MSCRICLNFTFFCELESKGDNVEYFVNGLSSYHEVGVDTLVFVEWFTVCKELSERLSQMILSDTSL